MAGRIRTAKNEFDEQDRVARLTDGAYRLFCGVRSLADDRGDCPGEPSYLARLFYGRPRSLTAIGKLIDELEKARLVDRYTADGARYLAIIGWLEEGSPTYQRIDKPQKPKYPEPTSVRSWNGLGAVAERSTLEGIRSGKEGEENGGGVRPRAPARSQAPAPEPPPDPAPTPTRLLIGWSPDPESEANREAEAAAIARGADVAQQLASFHENALEKGRTSCDWNASWRKWLLTARPAPTGNGHARNEDDYTAAYNRRYPVLDDKPRDPRVGQAPDIPRDAYGPSGEIDLETGEVIPGTEDTTTTEERLAWAAQTRQDLSPYTPKPAAATADEPHDETDAGSEP